MFGIVIALYDEAYELFPLLRREKIDGVSQYIGSLSGQKASLFLCKPGVRRKREFIKWMEQHPFTHIVNIGLAGALRPGFAAGDICHVHLPDQTSARQKDSICIVSAGAPVFTPEEKTELYLSTQADLVDMESQIIEKTLQEKKPGLARSYLKIVGDIFGDEAYLASEQQMRRYFSTFGFLNRLNIIMKSGPITFFHLYRKKRFLQKRIKQALFDTLGGLQ